MSFNSCIVIHGDIFLLDKNMYIFWNSNSCGGGICNVCLSGLISHGGSGLDVHEYV